MHAASTFQNPSSVAFAFHVAYLSQNPFFPDLILHVAHTSGNPDFVVFTLHQPHTLTSSLLLCLHYMWLYLAAKAFAIFTLNVTCNFLSFHSFTMHVASSVALKLHMDCTLHILILLILHCLVLSSRNPNFSASILPVTCKLQNRSQIIFLLHMESHFEILQLHVPRNFKMPLFCCLYLVCGSYLEENFSCFLIACVSNISDGFLA